MARPIKKGVDYFSCDTDLFNDRKIKRLIRKNGIESFTIYWYVLNEIYRDQGYYLKWDKDYSFDVSDFFNCPESLIIDVLTSCINLNLFDEGIFNKYSVLTSKSIQQRWLKIVSDAKRKETDIIQHYELTLEETPLTLEETPLIMEETPEKEEESTQSIEEYSIVKNSKEEKSVRTVVHDYPKSCKFIETATFVSDYLLESICLYDPTHKYNINPPSLKSWIIDIEKAIRLDGRTEDQLKFIIYYIFRTNGKHSDFWSGNVQSGAKLRKHFDTIKNQIKSEKTNGRTNHDYGKKLAEADDFLDRYYSESEQ